MKPGRSAAILAQPYFQGQKSLSSSRRHKVPLWWVLLDSGSDGDLLFQKCGARSLNKSVLYVIRAIPQSWHISSRIFHMEKQGECQVIFVEYSQSKRVSINPDIVEFDKKGPESFLTW